MLDIGLFFCLEGELTGVTVMNIELFEDSYLCLKEASNSYKSLSLLDFSSYGICT